MKIYIATFISILMVVASFAQGTIQRTIDSPCDSIYFTVTEYPVRLNNDLSELSETLLEKVILYSGDKEVSEVFIYRFKIDCDGKNSGSVLLSGKYGGLSKRIQKLLDDNCIWMPAIQLEKPVNSFYQLKVKLHNGEMEIVSQ